MENVNFSEKFAIKQALNYLRNQKNVTTQDILNSGEIPQLYGFTVVPGKVSDSIFGGKGSYINKDGQKIEFENPPLLDKDDNPIRILVRSERISTHDISRGSIPFKDQVLSLNHNFMRKLVKPFMPHAQYEVDIPDTAVVSFAKNLEAFPIENVVRGYMAKTTTKTSLYHQYFIEGKKEFCGIALFYYEDELFPNKPLPFVMDTPSTKSSTHDESVPPEELFGKGKFDAQYWRAIRNNSLVAFGVVSCYLRQKGIILVDTKTEHGIDENGKVYAMDELYTMDSSRYWKMDKDDLLLEENGEPISFSKEFARGLSKGESGYSTEESAIISARYVQGIQMLTGQKFEPDLTPWRDRVINQIKQGIIELV